jgi:hypothetical protein
MPFVITQPKMPAQTTEDLEADRAASPSQAKFVPRA